MPCCRHTSFGKHRPQDTSEGMPRRLPGGPGKEAQEGPNRGPQDPHPQQKRLQKQKHDKHDQTPKTKDRQKQDKATARQRQDIDDKERATKFHKTAEAKLHEAEGQTKGETKLSLPLITAGPNLSGPPGPQRKLINLLNGFFIRFGFLRYLLFVLLVVVLFFSRFFFAGVYNIDFPSISDLIERPRDSFGEGSG